MRIDEDVQEVKSYCGSILSIFIVVLVIVYALQKINVLLLRKDVTIV